MQIQADLNSQLQDIVRANPSFLAGLKQELITGVAAGDGMYSGDPAYYLRCGRSALDVISIAIERAGRKQEDFDAVLDFACGFGRVTRWLIAAFPAARVEGMDTNLKSVNAARALFGIPIHHVERDWRNVPEDQFDLIWVGSLFTHLSEEKSNVLLALMRRLLKPGGVLAATTHGEYVINRIETREKTYNLQEQAIEQILSQYKATRYGFCGYDYHPEYGISITSPDKFIEMARQAQLQPLVSIDRGWIQHQDFLAFYR